MDRTAFLIGEAAKASGLSVKTIRHYEQVGLIPKAARTNGGSRTGGHRLYSQADVGRLRFIRQARLVALGLPDIRELLALAERKGCPASLPEYQKVLSKHLRDIDECVRHLLGLRAVIEDLLSAAPQPICCRPHRNPRAKGVPGGLARVCGNGST